MEEALGYTGEVQRMHESYSEDRASHLGPESCVSVCKDRGTVLTGGSAGTLVSREIRRVRGANAVSKSGRRHVLSCQGERITSRCSCNRSTIASTPREKLSFHNLSLSTCGVFMRYGKVTPWTFCPPRRNISITGFPSRSSATPCGSPSGSA